MAITDWPVAERPREKLLTFGPQALSDAELLAIFLRTGCAGKSAVDLARDLLNKFNGLRPLLEADKRTFCQAHGLGDAKYSQLQAVLEMSRRHLAQSLEHRELFAGANDVKKYLLAKLRHCQREVFGVLFLDSQHRLIKYEELFQGTINSAHVYPREVIKAVLKLNAAAVILAHNHPSGVARPSQADRDITNDISQILKALDVRVLDHMVVGDTEVCSLAEMGWI
ncbi:MAG: DNA repair protein RadC [Cellvibrionaceae bacterium]|jgi:DNA repair protein RadC